SEPRSLLTYSRISRKWRTPRWRPHRDSPASLARRMFALRRHPNPRSAPSPPRFRLTKTKTLPPSEPGKASDNKPLRETMITTPGTPDEPSFQLHAYLEHGHLVIHFKTNDDDSVMVTTYVVSMG